MPWRIFSCVTMRYFFRFPWYSEKIPYFIGYWEILWKIFVKMGRSLESRNIRAFVTISINTDTRSILWIFSEIIPLQLFPFYLLPKALFRIYNELFRYQSNRSFSQNGGKSDRSGEMSNFMWMCEHSIIRV